MPDHRHYHGALAQAVPERAAAADGASGCNFLFGGVHPETDSITPIIISKTSAGARRQSTTATIRSARRWQSAVTFPWKSSKRAIRSSFGLSPVHRQRRCRRASRWSGDRTYLGGARSRDHRERVVRSHAGSTLGFGGRRHRRHHRDRYSARRDREFRLFSDVFGTVSPSKFTNILVHEGDLIRITSAGGGGYGNALVRPPEAVLADVRNRYVTPGAARSSMASRLNPATATGHWT